MACNGQSRGKETPFYPGAHIRRSSVPAITGIPVVDLLIVVLIVLLLLYGVFRLISHF
jgi:hypothetical protein